MISFLFLYRLLLHTIKLDSICQFEKYKHELTVFSYFWRKIFLQCHFHEHFKLFIFIFLFKVLQIQNWSSKQIKNNLASGVRFFLKLMPEEPIRILYCFTKTCIYKYRGVEHCAWNHLSFNL